MTTETMTKSITRECVRSLAIQLDESLRQVITDRLGFIPELSALKGRLEKVVRIDDPHQCEHWYLDGDLLLVVYPVEFESDGMHVKATRRVERPMIEGRD